MTAGRRQKPEVATTTRGGAAALGGAMLFWACAQAAPEAVAPVVIRDIVRRHWDQVCMDAREPSGVLLISEIFDTVGLGDELVGRGLRPPPRAGEGPSVDFVTRYGADGRLRAMGVWDFDVDSAVALAAGAVLQSRALELGGLLGPTGFRSRLTLSPWPRLELAEPIECQPHMVHLGREPPVGLPDTVRTFTGRASIRAGNDSTVEVDIAIDARGQVTSVQKRRGSDGAFRAAQEVIAQLRFDPALRNGEAVNGVLHQNFRFARGAKLAPEVRDSLFLVQRGFDLRRTSFQAAVREGPIRTPPARGLLGLLEGRPGVRVERGGGPTSVYVGDADCPVQVLVNGGLPSAEGVRISGLSGLLDMNARMAATALTGLELYAPEERVVADSLGCGSLLIWSAPLAGVIDEPFVGGVDGVLGGMDADEYAVTEVSAEPGGQTGWVSLSGRFRLAGLHPGRYTLEFRRLGVGIATGEVTVTAHDTVSVSVVRDEMERDPWHPSEL